MLPATFSPPHLLAFSPPHLLAFSTLLSLLLPVSLLSCLLHISLTHSPPISVLASLVSSWLALVTLPLSSVVCHPPSFLRVQPTVICSSVSLSVKLLCTPVSSLNSTILRLSALVTLKGTLMSHGRPWTTMELAKIHKFLRPVAS